MKRIFTTLKEKWPEYLLEILVITIGILGAFLLQQWNQATNDRNREVIYLLSLQNEIQLNTRILEEHLDEIDTLRTDSYKAFKMINNTSVQVVADSIVRMTQNVYPYYGIAFNKSAYEDLVSSKGMDLISSDSLRRGILSLGQSMDKYQEFKDRLSGNFQDHIGPYFYKHANLQAMEGIGMDDLESSITVNVDAFVQNQYFNNILTERLIFLGNMKDYLTATKDKLTALDRAIKQYLE